MKNVVTDMLFLFTVYGSQYLGQFGHFDNLSGPAGLHKQVMSLFYLGVM